jgi:hypothetical protein
MKKHNKFSNSSPNPLPLIHFLSSISHLYMLFKIDSTSTQKNERSIVKSEKIEERRHKVLMQAIKVLYLKKLKNMNMFTKSQGCTCLLYNRKSLLCLFPQIVVALEILSDWKIFDFY